MLIATRNNCDPKGLRKRPFDKAGLSPGWAS